MVHEVTESFEISPTTKKAYINCMSMKTSKELYANLLENLCEDIEVLEGDERIELIHEPEGVDSALKRMITGCATTPNLWSDAYLAAFAETAGLTLVTFDQALAGKVKGAILLR